ncbi:formate dehydrogenase [Piscinibacter defluvii]|uniref:formate dehydrogenase n=1 Tax=Piscinibacter defluvii TaxID=1796922 RepID=UPI000FDDF0A4|nr:formate dehydrogenase [Piscinibacter defluvii]
MDQARSKLSRRQVFAGAGTAGALAAAAAVLPRVAQEPQAQAPQQPAPERGGGYQVTQRVLQYYQTARL